MRPGTDQEQASGHHWQGSEIPKLVITPRALGRPQGGRLVNRGCLLVDYG